MLINGRHPRADKRKTSTENQSTHGCVISRFMNTNHTPATHLVVEIVAEMFGFSFIIPRMSLHIFILSSILVYCLAPISRHTRGSPCCQWLANDPCSTSGSRSRTSHERW